MKGLFHAIARIVWIAAVHTHPASPTQPAQILCLPNCFPARKAIYNCLNEGNGPEVFL